MPREKDLLWEHIIVEAGKIRCKFCNTEFAGAGIARMKYHLAKVVQKDVRPCLSVNDTVLEMAKKSVEQLNVNRSKSKKAKISEYMTSMGSSPAEHAQQATHPSTLHGNTSDPSIPGPPSQQTLNTLWKKQEKADVDRLLSIALIDNNIPPYILRRESFINFVVGVANHGPGYYPPSSEKYRTSLLANLKEEVHEYVRSVQKTWEFSGCTIMSDGWKDGRNRPHTNLLVASPKGSVFWKSECTVGRKDAKFIADFIGAAIEEIGAHNIVQFISDNASVYTAAGHILEDRYPTIFKTNCAAHCLDLILEDIDKLSHVKPILENARNIVKFMYRTQKILDLMRAQTNGRELKRPGKTRFASQFLCLQSILKEEQALRFLVATEEWRTAEQCRSEEGIETTNIIQGNDFWKSGKELIAVVEPLVKVLRLVDGDGSTMGYVYEAMDRAKESIKKFYKDNFEKYDPFWDIIDMRWDRNLHSLLHAASAYFNPQFWYKGMIRYDSEIKRGVDTVIGKMVPQSDLRIVLDELKLYHSKDRNIFGLLAVEFLDKSHPKAAPECSNVLDAVEKIFPQGIPELMVDSKLQEIVIRAVELLPELWKQVGSYREAVAAYRRALLSQWSLDNECCARIQNRFAVFLLYGGVEAGATSLAAQIDGSFVPKNNLEEAILLLLILLRKCYHGMIPWDPSVMEHFIFALSLCGQASILAKQIEEALPGIYARCDRWNNLALCYCAVGQNKSALNLFRKSLNINETPDDILALLTAAKICSEDRFLAFEGITYARRAFAIAEARGGHLKGVCFRLLGICLGQQAKVVSSDLERTLLQTEALKSLEAAIGLEGYNPDIIFELGMEYAEHRNTNAALWYAKDFIDATGGSELKGWSFLALALSAQQRYSEADVVIDAALDETGKWDPGTLLRMKAKLKIAQSLPVEAVETYSLLLALVQAQRKSFGSAGNPPQMDENKVSEFEVWLGLANLYSSLSHWRDAEISLEKARTLKCHSAVVLHTEGVIYEARGQIKEALAAYSNGLSLDFDYVPCKVSIGALLWKTGSKYVSVARSFLSDALRQEPTNWLAWYYLGMIHRDNGRSSDAADCFQAACMLEESDPIENYDSTR